MITTYLTLSVFILCSSTLRCLLEAECRVSQWRGTQGGKKKAASGGSISIHMTVEHLLTPCVGWDPSRDGTRCVPTVIPPTCARITTSRVTRMLQPGPR